MNQVNLRNGMKLIFKPMTNIKDKVNITFVFNNVGFATDGEYSGISHLAEHMVFRGLLGALEDQKSLIKKITDLTGGIFTASTSYQNTVFSFETTTKNMQETIDLVVNMISNSNFGAFNKISNSNFGAFNKISNSNFGAFNNEKQVVKNELSMRIDNPKIQLLNLINESCKVYNYEYAQIKQLDVITPNILQNFVDQYYIPQNCTLILTGDIGEFSFQNWQQKTQSIIPELPTVNYSPSILLRNAPTNALYFSVFWQGANADDVEGIVNQTILYTLIGNGLASSLMQKIRTDEGLTYDIRPFNVVHSNYGLFGLMSSTERKFLQQAVKSSVEYISELKDNISCKQNEIEIIKTNLKNTYSMQHNSPASLTTEILELELIHKTKSELINIIDNTTIQGVQKYLSNMLEKGLSIAVYGDINSKHFDISKETTIEDFDDLNIAGYGDIDSKHFDISKETTIEDFYNQLEVYNFQHT